MHDREGDKGYINIEDLGITLTPKSFSSIKSQVSIEEDQQESFGPTLQNTLKNSETGEDAICAHLAHIVTSEALFLTKIQGPILRQLAQSFANSGATVSLFLDKETIF